MHERRRCLTFLTLEFIWLYVLIMSPTRFRLNLNSAVAWSSRNPLLETGVVSSCSVCLRTKWLWIWILLQSLGFIFENIFGPWKDKIFCPVFVFHRGMSNGTYGHVLYLNIEGLNISGIFRYNSSLVLKNGIHNTVFYSVCSWTWLSFPKVQWIETRPRR